LTDIYSIGAQSAIVFENRIIDLGKIALEDGQANANFNFKSVGRTYLMIKAAIADHDDVTVDWDKRLYQRDKKSAVTVHFVPQHEGVFQRKITLETNGTKRNSFVLTLKGEVVKTGKPVEQQTTVRKPSRPTTFTMPSAYNRGSGRSKVANSNMVIARKTADGQTIFPVSSHGFGLTTRMIDFQRVNKGGKPTVTIRIKNNTNKTRDIYFAPLFEYIEYKANPKTLKAGEEGEISLTLDSKKCPIWGPYQADFSLITDVGSTARNSPVLHFKVDIFEDFNLLTDEEKQNSPRAAFETMTINLGQIGQQKKKNITFTFSNKGKNPLQIRKIINNANELGIVTCSGTVDSGKNGVLELELNTTKQRTGSYTKKVIVQTNDPRNPQTELEIIYKI
jgi:hypothetical protein